MKNSEELEELENQIYNELWFDYNMNQLQKKEGDFDRIFDSVKSRIEKRLNGNFYTFNSANCWELEQKKLAILRNLLQTKLLKEGYAVE